MQSNIRVKQKCKDIKLVITDVDGVLTDGGRYYSKSGEILKKFHVRDGMAVNILLRNNIKTLILTKEKSPITRRWAKNMNITYVYEGFNKKETALSLICKKYKITSKNIAYIGDDVNDLEALKRVGFSSAPHDAVTQVKHAVDYVCESNGGDGCFREFSDTILLVKFAVKINWY